MSFDELAQWWREKIFTDLFLLESEARTKCKLLTAYLAFWGICVFYPIAEIKAGSNERPPFPLGLFRPWAHWNASSTKRAVA